MRAFLDLMPLIKEELPGYEFVFNGENTLRNPENGQYTLFGKWLDLPGGAITLSDADFQTIVKDLTDQYPVYIQIIKRRNELLHMNPHPIPFTELLAKKKQLILQGPPGTGKTRLAMDIAFQLVFNEPLSQDKALREMQIKTLEDTRQFALVQFHPAYTYEDFVRGITIEAKGPVATYETKDKVLMTMVDYALQNLNDSTKKVEDFTREQWTLNQVKAFAEDIEDILDKEELFPLNKTVTITGIDPDAFRYKGANWVSEQRIKFSDLVLTYLNDARSRQDVKKTPDLSGRGVSHASYDWALLKKFRDFLGDKKPESLQHALPEKKNFVLVIDEINRGNLPAILGELIYALEYRGQKVRTMYEKDGNDTLILPENLYIIGTMNTADRSAGHIDYAIRRRFTFAEILPDAQFVSEAAQTLFRDVSALFIRGDGRTPSEYLSSDFRPEDVWLGHSYFITKETDPVKIKRDLQLKLDYDIKPLLKEYLKDGILLPEVKNAIDDLHV
jgi:MoxR-like ATPase